MFLLFSCSADTFRSCRFCFAANSADRIGARRQPEPREEDPVSDWRFSAEEEVPSRQSCRERIEPVPTWGPGLAACVGGLSFAWSDLPAPLQDYSPAVRPRERISAISCSEDTSQRSAEESMAAWSEASSSSSSAASASAHERAWAV